MKQAYKLVIILFLCSGKQVIAQVSSPTDVFVEGLFKAIKNKDSVGYYRTVSDIKAARDLNIQFQTAFVKDTIQRKGAVALFQKLSDTDIRDWNVFNYRKMIESFESKKVDWKKAKLISYKVDTVIVGEGFLRLDGRISFAEGIKVYAIDFRGALSKKEKMYWVGPKEIYLKLISDGTEEKDIKINTIKQEGIKINQ